MAEELIFICLLVVFVPNCANPVTVSAFKIGGPVNVSPVACIGGGGQPLPVGNLREIDEEVESSYAVSSNPNVGTGMAPTTTGSQFMSHPSMLDIRIMMRTGNCTMCGVEVDRIFSGSWIFFLIFGAGASNWGGVEGNVLYYEAPSGWGEGDAP